MTSGFDELSLALFTTLAPAGTIAFIALALARLLERDHEAAVRIDRLAALPFSVVLVGFIASATHLGTPANALHVFSGVGRSPLSNEVLAAVAFLFLAGSYWMAAFKQHFPDSVAKPWLVLTCAAGAALVACTSLAYAVDTVPGTPGSRRRTCGSRRCWRGRCSGCCSCTWHAPGGDGTTPCSWR